MVVAMELEEKPLLSLPRLLCQPGLSWGSFASDRSLVLKHTVINSLVELGDFSSYGFRGRFVRVAYMHSYSWSVSSVMMTGLN